MLYRPDGSRLSSDLSARDSRDWRLRSPATFSAASSSHPPRKTDNLRNTPCSSSDSNFQEWSKTARRLLCRGEVSRDEDVRKSRLSPIDAAIRFGGKWRTQAAAST